MALDNATIFKLGKTLANLLTNEYGSKYLSIQKIKNIIGSDHFAQLIISKATTTADKIKILYCAKQLHFNPTQTINDLNNNLNQMYVVKYEVYDDASYGKEDCGTCDGDGLVDCWNCDGNGEVDCKGCDGEGEVECDGCSGTGKEDCRYCDGKGTETEEDDEGNEIEVECVHCDGSGEENCRDCGGGGSFECPTCGGDKTERCHNCDNTGQEYCESCGGSGEQETYDKYYSVTINYEIVINRRAPILDGKIFTEERFDEIHHNHQLFDDSFTISYHSHQDNIDSDSRNSQVGMEDNFVEIVDVVKLENAENYIKNLKL